MQRVLKSRVLFKYFEKVALHISKERLFYVFHSLPREASTFTTAILLMVIELFPPSFSPFIRRNYYTERSLLSVII